MAEEQDDVCRVGVMRMETSARASGQDSTRGSHSQGKVTAALIGSGNSGAGPPTSGVYCTGGIGRSPFLRAARASFLSDRRRRVTGGESSERASGWRDRGR